MASGSTQQGIPTRLEDKEASQVPGSAGCSASKASKASKAKKVGKDERLDKQLGDNWGLETLVTVGESWLPAMIQQDEDGDTTDVPKDEGVDTTVFPVPKLFEFLVASIAGRWIYSGMMGAPGGTQNSGHTWWTEDAHAPESGHTWWTVDAHAPEASADVDDQIERALNILVRIIGMRLNAAWKSIQLGTLTIWNACSRNPSIERNVVEKGLCFRLVDIINTATWPPSLRDTAGGLLEFMAERYSNLQFFPLMGLPEDIDWPYDTPPPPGMVPTLAAHINLINSRIPILEYRGCHAVARMCFAAPYRSSNSKNFVRDAKAVSAVLGAVDAIIGLIKRVNKRYEDVLSGQIARLKQIAKDAVPEGEEDPSQYEKDMTSAEATQDVYFVLFAALLNISVLRSVQPMVARKGLMVLLGTNTYLYNRVLAAAERGQDVGGEEKLLHLCSSIIQNISLHPQNRTRLYKAELKGSTALEKLIEDAMATDDDHSTFFNGELLMHVSFLSFFRSVLCLFFAKQLYEAKLKGSTALEKLIEDAMLLCKAELKGSTALEKLIEDAMVPDDDHSTFFNIELLMHFSFLSFFRSVLCSFFAKQLYEAELKGSTALEKLIEDNMATHDDHSTFFNSELL
eukprot:gene25213-10858_t